MSCLAQDPATNDPVGVGIGAPGPVFGEGVTPDPNKMFVWDEALWVGVLYSSSIVVADIDFSALAGEIPERNYIKLPFVVRDCLKGSLPDTNLVLKVWSGYQKEMEAFDRLVAPESLPHWSAVSNAVAELTIDADHQSRSVDAILNLGIEAVPALIVLMDDCRELPVQSISLENSSPEHWEAYRHYGPKTVVDLADALADHSVKIGLGSVMNGVTEQNRRQAVARWKLFLVRWLEETESPASS